MLGTRLMYVYIFLILPFILQLCFHKLLTSKYMYFFPVYIFVVYLMSKQELCSLIEFSQLSLESTTVW